MELHQPNGEFLSTLSLSVNPPEAIFGSALGGAAMALFLGALTLPVIAKVGMTKGARFVPVVGVVLFLLVFVSFGEGGPWHPTFLTSSNGSLPQTMQYCTLSRDYALVRSYFTQLA